MASAAWLILMTLAAAAAPGDPDTVSEGVQWEATPSPADFARLGPPDAVASRTPGKVTLDCELNAQGRLRDCLIKNETPAGAGFGPAALRVAPLYRLKRPDEVELDGSRLTFTVRFRYPEPPPVIETASDLVARPVVSAIPAEIAAIGAPSGPLIRVSAVPGWQTDYLDLDRTFRNAGVVETDRVTVYAAPRTDTPNGAFEVVRLRLDCAAGVGMVVGVRIFDRSGGAVGWRAGSPAEAVAADTTEAVILDAACGPSPSRDGAPFLNDALAAPG